MITSLADKPDAADAERVAQDAAGVAFAGATDTNSSTIQSFILAMVLYPDVQRKAQAELDRVVGRDRLPNFNDRESLPYIEAVIKEALRWLPTAPMAVGHAASEDSEYDGYYIPKGTIVFGNTWAILRNPDHYPKPEEFLPDRYLNPSGNINPDVFDPSNACFGYGRRLCPGRYLAYDALYSTLANILHTFDITPALDEHGSPIQVHPELTPGLLSFPEPFQCTIKSRPDVSEPLLSL